METGKCAVLLCVLVAVTANVTRPELRCEFSVLIDHYKYDQSYDSFEAEVRESIKTTKNLFKTDDLSQIVDLTAAGVGLIPVVGGLGAFLPIVRDALAFESEWKLNFAKTILERSVSESKRVLAQGLVPIVDAELHTVLNKMEQLNDTKFSDEDRHTVVHILDASLDKLVNIFENSDIIFRQYPLLANKALISLGLCVPMFRIYERAVNPVLFNSSRLACHMQEVLRQYRPLVVRSRLENIEAPSWTIGGLKFNIWKDCYPEKEKLVLCEREYGECGRIVKDVMEDQAKMYDELVPFVEKTCLQKPRPSGFGWLLVELFYVETTHDDELHPTYKIVVDGETKFEKPEAAKKGLNYGNNFVYKSDKIKKNSNMVVEVWDSGKRILSQSVTFYDGYYSIRDGKREFRYSTFWIPENVYE